MCIRDRFTAAYLQSKGDVITDLHEDMAAEQKARTTYDNIQMCIRDRYSCYIHIIVLGFEDDLIPII